MWKAFKPVRFATGCDLDSGTNLFLDPIVTFFLQYLHQLRVTGLHNSTVEKDMDNLRDECSSEYADNG